MALLVNSWSTQQLLLWLQNNIQDYLFIKLYVNDHIPVFGEGPASSPYVEASFPGYFGNQKVHWGSLYAIANGAAIDGPAVTWSVTGSNSQVVYGYYLVDAGGNLFWAERDPAAPVSMTTVGQRYVVTPHFELVHE